MHPHGGERSSVTSCHLRALFLGRSSRTAEHSADNREADGATPSVPTRKYRGGSVTEARECATFTAWVRLPLAAPTTRDADSTESHPLTITQQKNHGAFGVVVCTPDCDPGSSGSIPERHPTVGGLRPRLRPNFRRCAKRLGRNSIVDRGTGVRFSRAPPTQYGSVAQQVERGAETPGLAQVQFLPDPPLHGAVVQQQNFAMALRGRGCDSLQLHHDEA